MSTSSLSGKSYQPLTTQQRNRLGKRWNRLFGWWDWLIQPEFEGLELIPDSGPVLFVGNHSLMAFADAVLMVRKILKEKGIVCRSLGLHAHFKVPVWGTFLAENGAVDGTRENCTAMMKAGEYVIVYPGGGGEVMKRKGEQHALRWKQRTGFARMAIENSCTIVPFSTVGADDCYDILFDNAQLGKNRLASRLIQWTGLKQEEIPPLIRGWGPTLLPKPKRIYFKFHSPIAAADYADEDIQEAAWALRTRVEHEVEQGIEALLQRRENDPLDSLANRLLSRIRISGFR